MRDFEYICQQSRRSQRYFKAMFEGVLVPLCTLWVAHSSLSSAQFLECPTFLDTATTAHLIARVVAKGDPQLPRITVLRNHTVCLSRNPENSSVNSVSQVVEYECADHVRCNSSRYDNGVLVEQFDFGCDDKGHRQWAASQLGNSVFRNISYPMADFNTSFRQDCTACIGSRVAHQLGFTDLDGLDPITHCLGCSGMCSDAGMRMCYGQGDATLCCNYYLDKECVDLCSNTTYPDSNFICQPVLVGFESEDYTVEEGQRYLTLPVVVREGLLTETVMLMAVAENKSATAGEDYRLQDDTVVLEPETNQTGYVHIEILFERNFEKALDFAVHLMVLPGYKVALSYSMATVVIKGRQSEVENSTDDSTVTPAPTTEPPEIENGCPSGKDRVWNLHWHSAAPGDTVTVSCGRDNVGYASRKCLVGAVWAAANVSLCENARIAEIRKMAEELFSRPDVEPDEALEVVSMLADVTTEIADPNTSQLPRDLNTVNDVITKTVDVLLQNVNSTENVNISKSAVVLDVLNNALQETNLNGYSSLQETGVGSQGSLNTAEMYGQFLAQTLTDMDKGEFVQSKPNVVLHSQVISNSPHSTVTGVDFPTQNSLSDFTSSSGVLANISIPGDQLLNMNLGNVTVTSLLFSDLHALLPPVFENGTAPKSLVISSQVHGTSTPNFEDNPVTITFVIKLNDTEHSPRCAFWDFSGSLRESGWSVDGVTTVSVTRDEDSVTVQCSSSHLTSFAVLVDVGGAQIDHKPLKVVSYIGIAISLACLFLTIIFFLHYGKKLFSEGHKLVHLNLAIALFVGYLIFGIGVELATSNEGACKAVAALIQYFLLAAFCWMMCEGVMLYLMLVVVFSRIIEKWWLFLLLGWGIPVIFVVIGVGSVLDEYGVRDSQGKLLYCWLSSGDGKHAIWTFVAPMLAIIIINVVFLVLVLGSIFKSKAGQNTGRRHKLALYLVKASLILLPLLGLTWVFGLFAVNENTVVFAWLFTIFNSLQGVFIFILHVVRNQKVWGKLKKTYRPYSVIRSWSRVTSSTTGSVSRYSRRKGSESYKETEKKEEMMSQVCSNEGENEIKSDQNHKLEESNSDESGYHGEETV